MSYKLEPYPALRKMLSDAWAVTKSNHTFVALIDADITTVRQLIDRYKQQTTEKLSLTAYISYCVAKTIDAHKGVCALRTWSGNNLITYDDVDLNILIEKEINGDLLGLVHIVRAANTKSFLDIHRDIRHAQTKTPEEVSGVKGREWLINILMAMPGFIRRMVWRILLANPHFIKRMMGTVSISAVGMAGKGGGWGIPGKALTFSVVIGGICEKPVINGEGDIANHEFVDLTFLFDHEVIDGAQAARFLKDLKQMIVSGKALQELLAPQVIEQN